MKPSNYNFTFSYLYDPMKIVFYNSFSGALALIDITKYAMYKRYCDNGDEIEDAELLGDLIRGHYLIQDNYNELEQIRLRMYKARFRSSALGLTIAPTSDCNFRCIYCYEKGNLMGTKMAPDVEEKIVEMVTNYARNISALSISWYGGEPLLAIDVISNLTENFLDICKNNNIQYNASIVTNGYLLTPDLAQMFKALEISSMQITIDGSPTEHNKRRPLSNGGETFFTIMENLKSAKEYLPARTSIRINVDKGNDKRIEEVIHYINQFGLKDAVVPYLARVDNINDKYDVQLCLDVKEFSNLDLSFRKNQNQIIQSYPRQRSNYCGADCLQSFVINSDGRMYKCWSEIGLDDKCIGSLLGNQSVNIRVESDYLLFDPTIDANCSVCKYLPICMGGCPNRRKETNGCTLEKHNMGKYIDLLVDALREDKNKGA